MRNRSLPWLLPVLLFVLLFSGPALAAGDPLTVDLRDMLEDISSQEQLPVIVVFNEDPALRAVAGVGDFGLSGIMRAQDELLALLDDMVPTQRYRHIPAMALSLGRDDILWLADLNSIARIEYDAPVYACMETAALWTGASTAREDYGLSGNGVTVAVIDTGIDGGHAAFGDRVVAFKDLVNQRDDAYDDNGHGTHCAGIIAGSGHDGLDMGVAPAAELVGVKVLSKNGSASSSTVIAGIDWCIDNKDTYGIDIISLSLGGAGSSNGQDANCLAAERAVEAGLVTVIAAGNSGPRPKTIGSPGAAEKVITVGAMSDPGEGGFFLADFSSRGPTADNRVKPDISAPGYNIMAPEANTTDGYIAHSGTSMATPFVSGTAALLLEDNSTLTNQDIKDILCNTAEDWGKPGKDSDSGAGRLDVLNAVSGFSADAPAHLVKIDTLKGWYWFSRASDKVDDWTFEVTDTSQPIGVSMIIEPWRSILLIFASHDYNLSLIDPDGKTVASSTSTLKRQETLTFQPEITGTYTIRVNARKGRGSYILDVSAGTDSAALIGG